MSQAKISAFFKPCNDKKSNPTMAFSLPESSNFLEREERILVTYGRRNPDNKAKGVGSSVSDSEDDMTPIEDVGGRDETIESKRDDAFGESQVGCSDSKSEEREYFYVDSLDSSGKPASLSTNLKKKRKYAQYHLELGQSNFYLHTCSTCGIKYQRGDEEDEKFHKTFHNKYHLGIRFKGWRNERVVCTLPSSDDRVIFVVDGDPPAHRDKVQEVITMMENDLDLNAGWLFHKLCKAYLFISSQRIVGCLVAEPIRDAHRLISSSDNGNQLSSMACRNSDRPKSKTVKSKSAFLRFGVVDFPREVIKNHPFTINSPSVIGKVPNESVLYQEEAIPALCGIRAIWVVPSQRRQGVATRLLDALRKSFCMGYVLEPSQCAFSHPTTAGKALATSYSGTNSFLVYNAGTHHC